MVAPTRHRRLLHPDGRSFVGDLTTTGSPGLTVFEPNTRYRLTVRISKGIGTRGGRLDVRGLAIRLHLPGGDLDVLLSTAGRGPLTRHLPAPRRTFDAVYGSITAYRSGSGRKIYLFAQPDPEEPALGRTLRSLGEGDRLVLGYRHRGAAFPIGRVTLGLELPAGADATLAFDAIRNSRPELHPSGLIHGARAFAYRWSQRRRGASPIPENPAAVARTNAHR